MVTAEQVDKWRAQRSETRAIEFKEAKNSFDHGKLFKYCVAIANERGGYLVLGVEDKPPRRVVGTLAFQNAVAIEEEIYNKLGFRVDVEEVDHPAGRVLTFEIPSRPIGTAFHLEGAYWMRSGSNLVAMTPGQLKKIFAEGETPWIEQTCVGGLGAAEVIDLLDTQSYFDLMQQPYPTKQAGVIERLAGQQLIDRTHEGLSIRRLGALLLAKNLESFDGLARKAPRVIVYTGVDKLERRLSQFGRRGYAVGFERLVEFVMSQVPQNEVIQDALRLEHKLLPTAGIRELLANALVHQDLTVPGLSPTVEIYSNRVEITNAGEPLVAVERFIDECQTRNERLADFMRRMRICEEVGSGVDRLVALAENFQLPAPYFGRSALRTNVIVYGPSDFEDMDKQARIRACYQHCALKHVMAQHMTNQTLRKRFGLPEARKATVTQIINATVEAGLIRPDEAVGESRRYARYVPFWG